MLTLALGRFENRAQSFGMRLLGRTIRPNDPTQRRNAQAGFTLVEVMVVVAIIAIATAAVSFSVFSRSESALRKDAERLVQLFAVAQSEARAGGRSIY